MARAPHRNASPPRWGVALLNLGGPQTPGDVEPFLFNLLDDMLGVPFGPLRRLLARRVAKKRARVVAPRYEAIGGGSPLRQQTETQARALAAALGDLGAPVAVAMRYAPPRADEAAATLKESGATHVVALPLYPQYSKATSGSSLADFRAAAEAAGLRSAEVAEGWPEMSGFVEAVAADLNAQLDGLNNAVVVFSAHGLPEKSARNGDAYPGEVARTVAALASRLPSGTRWTQAYQSRLGPVRWLGPHLDETVRRLGAEGARAVVVVPVSFVSEHLETLYELDIELEAQARAAGVKTYRRVATPQSHPAFIAGLADLVRQVITRAEKEGLEPR